MSGREWLSKNRSFLENADRTVGTDALTLVVAHGLRSGPPIKKAADEKKASAENVVSVRKGGDRE